MLLERGLRRFGAHFAANETILRFDPERAGEDGAMADQLETEIVDRIKAHADPEAGEITTATELTMLGIHSLELTEVIFDIEEAYGIEVEMNTAEAWSSLKTVGDIVAAVRKLIAAKG